MASLEYCFNKNYYPGEIILQNSKSTKSKDQGLHSKLTKDNLLP